MPIVPEKLLVEPLINLLPFLTPLKPFIQGIADASLLLGLVTIYSLLAIYLERKLVARIMHRRGPVFVDPPWLIKGGRIGILQNIADFFKMLGKEDIVPDHADKLGFNAAMFYIISSAFIGVAVIPLSFDLFLSSPAIGVLYLFGFSSLYPIGVLLVGWSSNNKYSIIGGFRSAAQLISYEIPYLLATLGVLMITGSFAIADIIEAQKGNWFLFFGFDFYQIPVLGNAFKALGLSGIPLPLPVGLLGFIIWMVAMAAENERIPFDLPEAEAELVMGWRTELAGIRYMMVMAVEYFHLFVNSALTAILFLGGWYLPFINEYPTITLGPLALTPSFFQFVVFWIIKIPLVTFIMIVLRGALPRTRIDQLLDIGWKRLVPLAIVYLAAVVFVMLFSANPHYNPALG